MEAKCVSFPYKSWDGFFVLKSVSGIVVVDVEEEMKGKRRESKERNKAKGEEEKEAIALFFWGSVPFGPKLNSTNSLVVQ